MVAMSLKTLGLAASVVTGSAATVDAQANPIGKVIELLENLDAKIVAEGKDGQKRYTELTEFCEERVANLGFEIKTSKGEKAGLEAQIGKEGARIAALQDKVESLAAGIAANDADL